jgi:hypothetical protein
MTLSRVDLERAWVLLAGRSFPISVGMDFWRSQLPSYVKVEAAPRAARAREAPRAK